METVMVCLQGKMHVDDSQIAVETTKDPQEMGEMVEDFLPAAEENNLETAEDSLATAVDFLTLQAKVLVEAEVEADAEAEDTHLEDQQQVSLTDSCLE